MKCQWCNTEITGKDTIGINRKLIAIDTTEFYCLDCMAEYFGCTKQDILDKIEEFKAEGCTLFQ